LLNDIREEATMSRLEQWLWGCGRVALLAAVVAGSWAPTRAIADDPSDGGTPGPAATATTSGGQTRGTADPPKKQIIKPEEGAAAGSGLSPWYTSVTLGSEFMPNYDEGKSTGLNRQQFFARIVVDGAWQVWRPQSLLHAGADVELRGVPVVRGESQDGTADNKTIPDKFADVANAITSSIYFDLPLATWDSAAVREEKQERGETQAAGTARRRCAGTGFKAVDLSRLGLRWQTGVISREEKAGNDDTVIWFTSLGVRYSFDEYRAECHRNGLPAGYLSVSGAYFEDYGGIEDRLRLIVDAAYRITEIAPFYLGLRSNLGSGPDELSVTFSFVFNSEKLLGLFAHGG
jgi:hypothetical protein